MVKKAYIEPGRCQNREFCSTGREAQLTVYEAVQIAVRGGKQIRTLQVLGGVLTPPTYSYCHVLGGGG